VVERSHPPQVNIRNIELLNNPAKFDDAYNFRIKFEAIAPLAEGE
jgi:histone chaperone ASF1